MKKSEIKFILLFILSVFLLTGCGSLDNNDETNKVDASGAATVKEQIVSDDFNESGTGILRCVTEAEAGEGIDVDITYVVNYKNGNILNLRSVQKVISDNDASLDLYEDAFKGISENYSGLKYYDVSLIRSNDNVVYDVVINYDKIDTKKLLLIEGEEDNIIVNGKAKLSLWLDLASKFGTTCEEK